MMNRRNFLRSTVAGLGVGAGFASNLASFNAFASGATDYKALVCVFLMGGMDSHDTIIPYDSLSSQSYERIREPLLAAYDAEGVSRRRSALLALNGNLEGRSFAMPREFANMHSLYQQGNAAIVGNVGPLFEYVTRASYFDGSAAIPPKLGSHNDQQSTWMTSRPEGATTGWGGRFGDILDASSVNANASFTAVSTAGNTVFLNGESTNPTIVATSGAVGVRELGVNTMFSATLEQVMRDVEGDRSNLLQRDLVRISNRSIDSNRLLNEQLELPGDPTTLFPESRLAQQLRMVARLIARRNSLGMRRQIFFVPAFGFDTHSDQALKLPTLQTDIDTAIRAFYDATVELGIENEVTTFTASDFGRTLGVNNNGTDHGWGGHHLVVGGAVNGGTIYGDIPPPELGHSQDYGRGRLIPQVSVDQYAATLGRWFGLSNSELTEAIPDLNRFDSATLAGLFG